MDDAEKKVRVDCAEAVSALGAACARGIESNSICAHVAFLVAHGWKMTFRYTEEGFILQGKAPR